jgi:hypothetical protein
MQALSQHVSSLKKYFSHDIAMLIERVDAIERSMDVFVTDAHFEMNAAENRELFRGLGIAMNDMEKQIAVAVRHEAALREELSILFFDALGKEIENRVDDMLKLERSIQEVLSSGGNQPISDDVARILSDADLPEFDVHRKSIATSLSELRTLLKGEMLQDHSSAVDPQSLPVSGAGLDSPLHFAMQSKPDWSPKIKASLEELPKIIKSDSSSKSVNSANQAKVSAFETRGGPMIVCST